MIIDEANKEKKKKKMRSFLNYYSQYEPLGKHTTHFRHAYYMKVPCIQNVSRKSLLFEPKNTPKSVRLRVSMIIS